MAFEIEIKARVEESEVKNVLEALEKASWTDSLGLIDKDDIYWGHDGKAVFRTRHETDNNGTSILFTTKPSQVSDDGIENNIELEFKAFDEWKECLEFQKALGYEIVRHKFKNGSHFKAFVDGFEIHVELLNVKYLGWFLEMEYCPDYADEEKIKKATEALYKILSYCGLSKYRIESKSYTKMLYDCGHLLG